MSNRPGRFLKTVRVGVLPWADEGDAGSSAGCEVGGGEV